MAEMSQITIGAKVKCADGVCGEVTRVVVDPVARTVTHLVVRPKHAHTLDRLIPLDLVEGTTDGGVQVRCSVAEFDKLDVAEEVHFMPGSDTVAGYSPEQTLQLPYIAMRGGFLGPLPSQSGAKVTSETVPAGEVDVRRGDTVRATDGEVGLVEGLIIDPSDHQVTHVLLQEGHLWGRKQVAIPFGVVTKVDAGVDVSLTKQELHDLPPVDVEHPNQ
jgi:sporulation protein YlmC with PRC-barrel domain